MKHSVVLLALCALALAASGPAPASQPVARGKLWMSLAEMTPAERSNAEIWIEPGPGSTPEAYAEARAISGLWNSGEYEAAIERARDFSRYGNPDEVAVAVSPRKLIRCQPGLDDDICIGPRDSLYGCSFDRLNNGWLFASFPARAGDRTYIYSYRSTDNGATWEELAQLQWNHRLYVQTTTAVCHGDYLVIAVAVKGASSNLGMTARISTTTGQFVNYPGDSLFVIAFLSNPDTAIVEFAGASSEDQSPGSAVYLFGRTETGILKYAWTDSSCRAWRVMYTNVNSGCDGNLDCTWNEGFDLKYIWAVWMQQDGDTGEVWYGYWETGNPQFQVLNSGRLMPGTSWNSPMTAVTAYRDTVLIAYESVSGRKVGLVYCFDCDSGYWYTADLAEIPTDFFHSVEACGRRGGGFAAAHSDGPYQTCRLTFQHAGGVSGPYTEPDTVSELVPSVARRSCIENLGSGGYGIAWVSTYMGRNSAYFTRMNVIGIAEPRPARPRGADPAPTVVSAVWFRLMLSDGEFRDAAGRRVQNARPGVYFRLSDGRTSRLVVAR